MIERTSSLNPLALRAFTSMPFGIGVSSLASAAARVARVFSAAFESARRDFTASPTYRVISLRLQHDPTVLTSGGALLLCPFFAFLPDSGLYGDSAISIMANA